MSGSHRTAQGDSSGSHKGLSLRSGDGDAAGGLYRRRGLWQGLGQSQRAGHGRHRWKRLRYGLTGLPPRREQVLESRGTVLHASGGFIQGGAKVSSRLLLAHEYLEHELVVVVVAGAAVAVPDDHAQVFVHLGQVNHFLLLLGVVLGPGKTPALVI